MFLARRPSADDIRRFLDRSRDLPLSYPAIGILDQTPRHGRFDEALAVLGRGSDDFDRTRAALATWKHFDIGWVDVFPRDASCDPGTTVAVLIRHLGFWSLNGARVVYGVDETRRRSAFGFAYGTLTNHAESGEELFEVFMDEQTSDVMYRIRAVSWPQSVVARVGTPIVRRLQARFRRDSAAAMTRAIRR